MSSNTTATRSASHTVLRAAALFVIGCAAALSAFPTDARASSSFSAVSAPESGGQLGVQGCNTRCQTVQTDCALRCDGDIPCIQNCQKVADTCVEKCTPAP